MTVRNIVPIDDFRRRCRVTQREEGNKHSNVQEKEYLLAASYPARFPKKRVYAHSAKAKGIISAKMPRCRRTAFAPNLSIVSPKKLAMKV